MQVKFLSVEKTQTRDLLITAEVTTGCWWWTEVQTVQARGWCTVYHWYPSGQRCSTDWEIRFGAAVKAWAFSCEDPWAGMTP